MTWLFFMQFEWIFSVKYHFAFFAYKLLLGFCCIIFSNRRNSHLFYCWILVLKVDLTLLIKILFKFYFDSKWSNRRSPSLGSRSRPYLKYFQELGIVVIIIPSSTKINDHFLKMPQALFKYNAFFIFYHESFGIVWTLATFNPNRFEPTRKVSSSLISCYYQPLTLGLEARFDIKSAMRDFSKNVLFRK